MTTQNLNTEFDNTETLIRFLQLPRPSTDVTDFLEPISAGSTIGLVRSENQDRYVVARFSHPKIGRSFFVAAVADGVGSLPESGLSASATIASFIATLASEMERYTYSATNTEIERCLNDAAQKANQYVYKKTGDQGASTLSAIAIINESTYAIQVGDSKIFGIDEHFSITQLSKDQTVGTHLEALGLNLPDHSGRDPRFDRALAQYFGMADPLQPKITQLEKKWSMLAVATDGIAPAQKELSSDGWCLMHKNAKSQSDFIRKTLHLSNWLGGTDNCTLVLFKALRELVTASPSQDFGLLNVVSGSRTLELRGKQLSINYPEIKNTLIHDYKRQKQHKIKRGHKEDTNQASPNTPESKPAPTITFLPGLTKDEDATGNP